MGNAACGLLPQYTESSKLIQLIELPTKSSFDLFLTLNGQLMH